MQPLLATSSEDQNQPKVQPTVSFEYLAKHRKLLQEFCRFHLPSLECFISDDPPIFKLTFDAPPPKEFKHITSSATCYSSLDLYTESSRPRTEVNFGALGHQFALRAIEEPVSKWKSDGKAEIYCSCRGLPYVLSRLDKWHPHIEEHLARIYYQLEKEPSRFAIGEASPLPDSATPAAKAAEEDGWYQPNAYHTYWALDLIGTLKGPKFKPERERSPYFKKLSERIDQMRLWARQQLGFQVALHSGKSSVLDSDQLAWSLAILISRPEDYQSNLAEQDFIRQAFKCLFATQETVGTWRHYAPLFHYPNVGNAYCYVFESFTTILTLVLKPEADFLRNVLRDYSPSLVRLWQYAVSTQSEITKTSSKAQRPGYGWSSGHRIRPKLESWATASVFAYAQALRRLVGIWTRDEAFNSLNYRTSTRTAEDAVDGLRKRASTWAHSDLADLLASMFINPLVDTNLPETCDPDEPLIGRNFPRSAILFGPPGTGKTSLVSAVAGAVGWKFIELHPSHFVSDGLPNVQHTADVIFSKLMEVDHAVILFDEIDELVRERELEPDQFGRFLTTSMLPRLAELWKARKVMYFVATNHIEYFDRAVTRSERFDAIIFISPPSFEKKRDQVLKILREKYSIEAKFVDELNQSRIDSAMPQNCCKDIDALASKTDRDVAKAKPLPPENSLAKFALVRWDELDEIALHLSDLLKGGSHVTEDILRNALLRLTDAKSRSLGEYCRFGSDPKDYERFDSSRSALWIVKDIEGFDGLQEHLPKSVKKRGGYYAIEAAIGNMSNVKVSGMKVEKYDASNAEHLLGTISLRKLNSEAIASTTK